MVTAMTEPVEAVGVGLGVEIGVELGVGTGATVGAGTVPPTACVVTVTAAGAAPFTHTPVSV